MKTRSLALLILALFTLLCILPTFAQDSTSEPTPAATVEATQEAPIVAVPSWVVIAILAAVSLIFLALLYNQQVVLKIIAPLVPVESSQQIIDAAMPTIMDYFMNNVAARIPTTIDDTAFIEAVWQRGLTVSLGDDGLYHTTRTQPTPVPSSSTLTRPLPLADDTSD